MTAKAAGVLVLVGLALVFLLAGCGSSGSKLYDAKATYSCLRKRPEYRPLVPNFYKWYPVSKTGVFLQLPLEKPVFNKSFVPNFKVGKGPDWWIPVDLSAPSFMNSPTSIILFKSPEAAWVTSNEYLLLARGLTAKERSQARRGSVLRQNALVDFGLGLDPLPKAIREIILGCLRSA